MGKIEESNATSPLHSFDAKVWADDFCAIAKTLGHELDGNWVLGWFASALMRGWDEHKKRNKEKLNAFEKGGAVERLVVFIKSQPFYQAEPAGVALADLIQPLESLLAPRNTPSEPGSGR